MKLIIIYCDNNTINKIFFNLYGLLCLQSLKYLKHIFHVSWLRGFFPPFPNTLIAFMANLFSQDLPPVRSQLQLIVSARPHEQLSSGVGPPFVYSAKMSLRTKNRSSHIYLTGVSFVRRMETTLGTNTDPSRLDFPLAFSLRV